MTELTSLQRAALDVAHAFPARSLTASFVAAQVGEPFEVRKWAAVLCSLADRGSLVQLADGFVGRTFWRLP